MNLNQAFLPKFLYCPNGYIRNNLKATNCKTAKELKHPESYTVFSNLSCLLYILYNFFILISESDY